MMNALTEMNHPKRPPTPPNNNNGPSKKMPWKPTSHSTVVTDKGPTYTSYAKLGRKDVQVTWDNGANITICTKSLAEKAGIKWKPTTSSVTYIDGSKGKVIGIAEEVNLKIADQPVPIQMQIVDSDRDEILIRGNWLERYQANLMLADNRISFKANQRLFNIKVIKYQGRIPKMNYLHQENEQVIVSQTPPPLYRPREVTYISSDEEDTNDEIVSMEHSDEETIVSNLRQEDIHMTAAELEARIDRWQQQIKDIKDFLASKEPNEVVILGQEDELNLHEIMTALEESLEEYVETNPMEYLANLCITMEQYLQIDEDIQDQWLYNAMGEEAINPTIKDVVDKILDDYEDIVSKGPHDIRNCITVEHAIRLLDKTSS